MPGTSTRSTARRYAVQAGENGGSVDAFLYMRCYGVARGQEFYESVKVNPVTVPKSLDYWCEALLGVSRRAWTVLTGGDEDEWDNDSPVSYETGSNRPNWD